jgi:hypothetical protein
VYCRSAKITVTLGSRPRNDGQPRESESCALVGNIGPPKIQYNSPSPGEGRRALVHVFRKADVISRSRQPYASSMCLAASHRPEKLI